MLPLAAGIYGVYVMYHKLIFTRRKWVCLNSELLCFLLSVRRCFILMLVKLLCSNF